MRTVTAITVGRSDWSIYLPVLRLIRKTPGLRLRLVVAGMHLSQEYGHTVRHIESDGFEADDRVEMVVSARTPESVARSMGMGLAGYSSVFARARPDIVLVLGDRYEMQAAALAALPFRIPVAHIHGGEITRGAFDDALRHTITKLSHLHFVAMEEYGRRVVQMGEEPWRVTVSGAPGLDTLMSARLLAPPELSRRLGFDCTVPYLLVTFHPATMELDMVDWQVAEFMAALDAARLPVLFTAVNADPGGDVIERAIRAYTQTHADSKLVDNLGTELYPSVMAAAAAMAGNSSSGIIEAPSFKLPVVNVGNRQSGRVRAMNVIDTAYDRQAVLTGIRRAASTEFRKSLSNLRNPYGDGHAAQRIVDRLANVPLDDTLIVKRFHDLPVQMG